MSGTDPVTRDEMDLALAEALAEAKQYTDTAEQRLREEWTDAVRHEVGKVDVHLGDQDTKINWILGLMATLLLAVIGWLIYFLLHFLPSGQLPT